MIVGSRVCVCQWLTEWSVNDSFEWLCLYECKSLRKTLVLYAKLICVRLSFDSIEFWAMSVCTAISYELMAPIQSTAVSVLFPHKHTQVNNHLLTYFNSLSLHNMCALCFSQCYTNISSDSNIFHWLYRLATSREYCECNDIRACVFVWTVMLYAHAFVCLHFYLSIFVYWLGGVQKLREKQKQAK